MTQLLDIALLKAAKTSDVVQVQHLLEQGANPNALDPRRWRALHFAAKAGSAKIATLLLDVGAEVDPHAVVDEEVNRQRLEGTITPLLLGLTAGHDEVSALLIDRGADVVQGDSIFRENASYLASKHGCCAALAKALAKAPEAIGRSNYDGLSALAAAVRGRHTTVVTQLLTIGVQIEPGTLIAACRAGELEIAVALASAGADLNALVRGRTPIAAAASGGHMRVVEWLLAQGIDINRQGLVALQLAAKNGHPNVVELLRQRGVVQLD